MRLRPVFHVKHRHPTKLCKLGLVGVKHIHSGSVIFEGKLYNPALRLTLHDRVNGAQGWRQSGAVVIIIKEIRVQMERVDRVKFGGINQLYPYRPVFID